MSSEISPQKSDQNVTLTAPFCGIVVIWGIAPLLAERGGAGGGETSSRRTFTTYRIRLSHPIVVANFAQLQLQQLQHFQHFQLFAAFAAIRKEESARGSTPD
jgi:hypothetical protein